VKNKELLRKYVRVRLYAGIDGVKEGVTQNPDPAEVRRLENDGFGNRAQPLYGIIKPTNKVVEGKRVFRRVDQKGGLIQSETLTKFLDDNAPKK
jgi:hypothetical protein